MHKGYFHALFSALTPAAPPTNNNNVIAAPAAERWAQWAVWASEASADARLWRRPSRVKHHVLAQ